MNPWRNSSNPVRKTKANSWKYLEKFYWKSSANTWRDFSGNSSWDCFRGFSKDYHCKFLLWFLQKILYKFLLRFLERFFQGRNKELLLELQREILLEFLQIFSTEISPGIVAEVSQTISAGIFSAIPLRSPLSILGGFSAWFFWENPARLLDFSGEIKGVERFQG